MKLINSDELIEKIKYSNKWNNVPCPDWVFGIIENMPEESEEKIIESYINRTIAELTKFVQPSKPMFEEGLTF